MKIDFRSINEKSIETNSVFYIYGNYKKVSDLFFDYIVNALKRKGCSIAVHFCNVNEAIKIANEKCDLFGDVTDCFLIKNIEDSHIDKLESMFADNNVFVLDSGNYAKSKKITDHFVKHSKVLSLASFRNNITFQSIIKMLLPNISYQEMNKIVELINKTDEYLSSFFKKISLLIQDNDSETLNEYYTYQNSFWSDMDFIPLTRFLIKNTINKSILNKGIRDVCICDAKPITFLLNAESTYKYQTTLSKSYIYNALSKMNKS